MVERINRLGRKVAGGQKVLSQTTPVEVVGALKLVRVPVVARALALDENGLRTVI